MILLDNNIIPNSISIWNYSIDIKDSNGNTIPMILAK